MCKLSVASSYIGSRGPAARAYGDSPPSVARDRALAGPYGARDRVRGALSACLLPMVANHPALDFHADKSTFIGPDYKPSILRAFRASNVFEVGGSVPNAIRMRVRKRRERNNGNATTKSNSRRLDFKSSRSGNRVDFIYVACRYHLSRCINYFTTNDRF